MKKAEQTFCTANNVKEPVYTWTPTVAPSGTEFMIRTMNHTVIFYSLEYYSGGIGNKLMWV